jgi:large subunit ribosomal protein L37Ae
MGKKIGLAGGFSARYGTVTRRQYVEIVTGLRGKHECPRCMFRTVKRWSVGVWHCRKCGYKFAGGAYTPRTKLGEIAARATRGLMSPSTLSTELDSLRAGAKVAITVTPQIKKTRTRRRKVVAPEAEKKAEEAPIEDPQPARIAEAKPATQPTDDA